MHPFLPKAVVIFAMSLFICEPVSADGSYGKAVACDGSNVIRFPDFKVRCLGKHLVHNSLDSAMPSAWYVTIMK